jgi:pyruvate kinase
MFSRAIARNITGRLLQSKAPLPQNVARHFSVKDFPEASRGARQLKTSFDLPDPTIDNPTGEKKYQLTKIVATIGPTSEQLEPLKKVVQAGMKIMRLNFSHATIEEVELRMKNLALSEVSFMSCYSWK